MRLLVVSDIHANFEALRAIPDSFDYVLCLGDLVDYGPEPEACLQWLRDRDAICVRGNHDQAVAAHVPCRGNPGLAQEAEATRRLFQDRLLPADASYLGTLPFQTRLRLGGMRFHLVHATPSDPLYTYVRPGDRGRWARELERVSADVLLVGHTHLPMILRIGEKTVINPGSVGQPRDGDPRASFAVIEDGRPRLDRVAYDVEATVRRLEKSALSPNVVRHLSTLLRTGTS
ncbi:MAG TPA: YfcE family phosphodiesterase [Thermoanaerobaculia bacterium]